MQLHTNVPHLTAINKKIENRKKTIRLSDQIFGLHLKGFSEDEILSIVMTKDHKEKHFGGTHVTPTSFSGKIICSFKGLKHFFSFRMHFALL